MSTLYESIGTPFTLSKSDVIKIFRLSTSGYCENSPFHFLFDRYYGIVPHVRNLNPVSCKGNGFLFRVRGIDPIFSGVLTSI